MNLIITFADGPWRGKTISGIQGKCVEMRIQIWRKSAKHYLGGYAKRYEFTYEYCFPIIENNVAFQCAAKLTTQSRNRWAQIRKFYE